LSGVRPYSFANEEEKEKEIPKVTKEDIGNRFWGELSASDIVHQPGDRKKPKKSAPKPSSKKKSVSKTAPDPLVPRARKTAKKFRGSEVERADVQKVEKALWYLQNGDLGVGKTHLAATLANRMLERGARVRFCNVIRWLNRLRDEMREEDSTEERMEDLEAADLLVLDDLGAQKNTAWALEQIYQVVNQRCQGLQPLVVTTNRNLNQLERAVGFRIFDRLLEICAPMQVKGEDWRTRIARERQFRGSSGE
jgi:DNA replication protein DnaC